MRKKITLFLTLCLLAAAACNSPETPTIPEPAPKAANIVMDGDVNRVMTDYGCLSFVATVKNIGNGIGYNCMVAISCFSDTGKTILVDTANGFPGNLGDIGVGVKAPFEAVAFNVKNPNQVQAWTIKITWLNR